MGSVLKWRKKKMSKKHHKRVLKQTRAQRRRHK
ncbi:MAG: AURKAIP1/COX24 domain-containing protein [Dehalococcoidia bacterium]|nr:MAG: AURKAIP1/COX24 domain-containing protein [Dehalococcoidia bacterium]